MKRNENCLNTVNDGCLWGKIIDWIILNRITRENDNLTVQYIGNYMTYDNDVYAVFYTPSTNYFIKID